MAFGLVFFVFLFFVLVFFVHQHYWSSSCFRRCIKNFDKNSFNFIFFFNLRICRRHGDVVIFHSFILQIYCWSKSLFSVGNNSEDWQELFWGPCASFAVLERNTQGSPELNSFQLLRLAYWSVKIKIFSYFIFLSKMLLYEMYITSTTTQKKHWSLMEFWIGRYFGFIHLHNKLF